MGTDQVTATDTAFCCFGLLVCAGETFERVIGILPPARQETIRQSLQGVKHLSRGELTDRLRHLRQESTAAELKRVGAHAKVRSLDTLPPAVQQWLCAQVQERHGREDHQG